MLITRLAYMPELTSVVPMGKSCLDSGSTKLVPVLVLKLVIISGVQGTSLRGLLNKLALLSLLIQNQLRVTRMVLVATPNSTKRMREDGGFEMIKKVILNLSLRHVDYISAYGEGNERRLTGKHETASIDTFSWGVANRGCLIRVGRDTEKNGKDKFPVKLQ
ncbi:hypothetical protein AAHE18_09G033900 [Arachis hypogaea]